MAVIEQDEAYAPTLPPPPAAPDPVTDVLEEALQILETHGWTKHTMVRLTGERCLLGALYAANHGDYFAAKPYVQRVTGYGIARWNDRPWRRYKHVRAALKQAIENRRRDTWQ